MIHNLAHMTWISLVLIGTIGIKSHLRANTSPHTPAPSSTCEMPVNYDLGQYTFPISTNNKMTQHLFNQAINWTYSFNHPEAERMFRAAAELDPNCAMCYWGAAYVLGPNINAPMAEEAVGPAYEAITKAQSLLQFASVKEQDYIKALSQRYSSNLKTDRNVLDQSYAEAMKELHQKYPDDLDIATLYAEAMMDTMPWNYWNKDGSPRPGTEELIATLQAVLEKNPYHPGANHYLIHIVEEHYPELATEAADRLLDLVPAAGHMQHMPSHIYIRVGRYHDGSISNQKGIQADLDYLAACPLRGSYDMMYVPHNYEFLVATASFEGRSELAIKTAFELQEYVEPHLKHSVAMFATMQQFWATPYLSLARFGQWEQILQQKMPDPDMKYALGIAYYARSLAFMNLGRMKEAKAELRQLMQVADLEELKVQLLMGLNPAADILKIAVKEAQGQIAAQELNYPLAIEHLREATSLQDALIYIEPPAWYQPVRLVLGRILLESGQAREAAEVFRKDLTMFPDNAWSLFGLDQSLHALGQLKLAEQIHSQYLKAWEYADVDLEDLF
ncbi:MAG: tetratricopeptide repeat protein [Oligoflexus sp.]